jgi:hypothetical protein
MKTLFATTTALALLITLLPADAATWVCNASGNRWSSQTQCGWVYSEQELYERGIARAGRALQNYNLNGMRPPYNACTAALESGMDNSVRKSYGCAD